MTCLKSPFFVVYSGININITIAIKVSIKSTTQTYQIKVLFPQLDFYRAQYKFEIIEKN
jgi:hypothetical protein